MLFFHSFTIARCALFRSHVFELQSPEAEWASFYYRTSMMLMMTMTEKDSWASSRLISILSYHT